MKWRHKPDIAALFAEGAQIDQAIVQAAKEAVEQHVRAGNPIAVMENGKVRWLTPAQVRRRVKRQPRCAG